MPDVLLTHPRFGGLVGALVSWSASLTPSLLPRPWYLQGFVSAFAIGIGYAIGSWLNVLVSWAWRFRTPLILSRMLRFTSLAATLGLLFWSVLLHYRWQIDVRRLMDMDGVVAVYALGVVVAGSVAGYGFIVLGRLARKGASAYFRLLRREESRFASGVIALITVMLLVGVVFDVLIADRFVPAFSDAYLASDRRFDVDVGRPESVERAGGPGSLTEWETMGRQGRAFVTQAPDVDQLQTFNGTSGLDPIRVYTGLRSADTPQARAELAVAELDRLGGFDRAVLVLITPTGTGWIDPFAVSPLEYLYNGDAAAVAVQYSHLPSWALMIGNQDHAIEASRELFEAVTDHLENVNTTRRPRLLLYGESLGSFGLEAIFSDEEEVRMKTDGVLWVGPPQFNRLWQRLVSERREDSPIWRPIFRNGEAIRFGPDGDTLAAVDGPWLEPRIAYLQHPSDPITWLNIDVLFKRPEWLNSPRGTDVSEHMPFIPVVTFWQLVVDLVMGTNAPLGHGHKFGLAQAEAWSLIAPPEDWSSDRTERLLVAVGDAE